MIIVLTVSPSLFQNGHYANLRELEMDLDLVFNNAQQFNDVNSRLSKVS